MKTHHVKYLSEGDANSDNNWLGSVVDGPDLPVVLPHEVVEEPRLLLHPVLLDWLWLCIIAGI